MVSNRLSGKCQFNAKNSFMGIFLLTDLSGQSIFTIRQRGYSVSKHDNLLLICAILN